jgi:exonuclease SbcC
MIPQRVTLKGFLCYKDEQEVCFDGASLWILAGVNGSGKSTIFDAVTYALFGHHRGGSQDAYELINKASDRAVVEFDFTIDGCNYQAHRTLQRTKQGKTRGTQQIYERNGCGSWEPIEGTNLKAGYDQWIHEHIGLNYETFTSSVLLLQGKADKLLDSTAKGRHDVLAGIVDLERYKRLHLKADEDRRAREFIVKNLRHRKDAIPEVSDATLLEVDKQIDAADLLRQQGQADMERLQGLEFLARQWADLQGRLAMARQRWQQAQQLLHDAPAIEHDLNRLAELREVLPRLQTVHQQKSDIHLSELKTRSLNGQKTQLEARIGQQTSTLEQARQQRSALQAQITADEQQQPELAMKFRKASELLDKLKEYERQENELSRWRTELTRLPEDPVAAICQARGAYDRLSAQALAVPLLIRFQTRRKELKQASLTATQQETARQEIEAQGKGLKEEAARLKPLLEEAIGARQQADEQATRALTLLEEARRQRDELAQLHGAKVCRHCGQTLTAGHLREEKRRREKEVAEVEKVAEKEGALQQATRKNEQELREHASRLETQLQEARDAFTEHKQKAAQSRQDVERLQGECSQIYQELAPPFRARISSSPLADWLESVSLTLEDLANLRREADGLATARQQLTEAEMQQAQWNMLKAQEAASQQQVLRLQGGLPADRALVRREHIRLETEQQVLERTLTARRAEVTAIQEQLDSLNRERDQTQQKLTALLGDLNTEETRRRLCGQTLERARKELPAPWQEEVERTGLAELHNLDAERAALVENQTDERGRRLQQARANLEGLAREKEDLEKLQDQYPEEARQEPAHLQALIKEARHTLRVREEELVQARQHKGELESYRKQRQQLEQEALQAEKEFGHAKLLADLLGRDRLQLHLVRQAERQVVDYANAVLDRLSGGQLFLKLCGEAGDDGNAAKALELETHNRTTGEMPINVAFLSGSQKFRVAVSLALGIGQYASRRHRPIESVIIDEGFGCLDREGRQAMIQEMQNLRDQLKCILLVSHQEEFASAFADGYHFEIRDKTTKATRWQR